MALCKTLFEETGLPYRAPDSGVADAYVYAMAEVDTYDEVLNHYRIRDLTDRVHYAGHITCCKGGRYGEEIIMVDLGETQMAVGMFLIDYGKDHAIYAWPMEASEALYCIEELRKDAADAPDECKD